MKTIFRLFLLLCTVLLGNISSHSFATGGGGGGGPMGSDGAIFIELKSGEIVSLISIAQPDLVTITLDSEILADKSPLGEIDWLGAGQKETLAEVIAKSRGDWVSTLTIPKKPARESYFESVFFDLCNTGVDMTSEEAIAALTYCALIFDNGELVQFPLKDPPAKKAMPLTSE